MKYVLLAIIVAITLFPQIFVKLLSDSAQDRVFVTLSADKF